MVTSEFSKYTVAKSLSEYMELIIGAYSKDLLCIYGFCRKVNMSYTDLYYIRKKTIFCIIALECSVLPLKINVVNYLRLSITYIAEMVIANKAIGMRVPHPNFIS